MNYKIIGIKELHKELKHISQEALSGQAYMVMKNTKPVFKIEPIDFNKRKKYKLKDFITLQFKSKDKNLSKNIDEFIY